VRGLELAIEQAEPACAQPRDEVRQRDLRCVGGAADHALAEERAAEREAVEPADELAAVPAFDRMREPHRVEGLEDAFDAVVDPRFGAARDAFGAELDDSLERGVDGDLEPVGRDCLAQRARELETVERQDGAAARLDPIDAGGVAAVGHREYADRIGTEHDLRIEDVAHAASVCSIRRHSSANACAAADRGANTPTGARLTAIDSIPLAIGITGQSG